MSLREVPTARPHETHPRKGAIRGDEPGNRRAGSSIAARPDPSPDEFRVAMRELAGAVSVISCGMGGRRTGFTATSVASLCLEPPTLIVCVNRSSSSWPALRESRRFGVNVLSASHRDLAHRFAGVSGADGSARYEGGEWIAQRSGTALLSDALAAFDCWIEDIVERRSHAIIIGRVEAMRRRGGGGALVYWRGDYDQLGWSAEEISNAVGPVRRP
jgi:flavin reductase (DIM6/NTAB) family NADH-FMN oxidoreductase RutF